MIINLPTMQQSVFKRYRSKNPYQFYPQDGDENQEITSLSPYV